MCDNSERDHGFSTDKLAHFYSAQVYPSTSYGGLLIEESSKLTSNLNLSLTANMTSVRSSSGQRQTRKITSRKNYSMTSIFKQSYLLLPAVIFN